MGFSESEEQKEKRLERSDQCQRGLQDTSSETSSTVGIRERGVGRALEETVAEKLPKFDQT